MHETSETKLKPARTPVRRFLNALILTVIFVSVFVYVANLRDRASVQWLMLIAICLLFLLALIMIINLIYCSLAVMLPSPQIRVLSPEIRLEKPFKLAWDFKSVPKRISHFIITIEGWEVYREIHGAKSRRIRNRFWQTAAVETNDPDRINSGSSEVVIPADLPPTNPHYSMKEKRIIWMLCVSGKIRNGPNINIKYEIPVLARN